MFSLRRKIVYKLHGAVTLKETDEIELVMVQLRKTNNKPVILYSYYLPPGIGFYGLQLLNDSLLSNPESSCIVVVGDFNVP